MNGERLIKKAWLDKFLNIMGYVFILVPFMILGAYSAMAADNLVPDNEGAEMGTELLLICAIMLVGMLFYLLHIVLHEGGHLIAGLIKGYHFLSFRVGSLTLVKREGKLQWKKTTVMGTGGQCLMIPPECKPEDCPFTLYLLGGGLMNLILGLVAVCIAIPVSGIVEVIFIVFALMGIGVGVSNLIPLKAGGMANDGYQLFIDIPKSPSTKKALYCLLTANALLTDLESTSDLPETITKYIMEADYSNLADTSVANLLCFKNCILIEKGQYDEVRVNCERMVNEDGVLGLFRNEAKCELIYLELIDKCSALKIDSLMDKKLKNYIKATGIYPSRKRLMYAYYLIYEKDREKAHKEYEALLKVCESHPSKAECAVERKEAEKIKMRFEN